MRPEPPDTAPSPSTAPATQPTLPEYLAVLGRFDDRRPADLTIIEAAGRRLALDTRNVRRLRITRAQLPLERDRSLVLILDGQGIEWRADSTVEEFERAETGAWLPAPPKTP